MVINLTRGGLAPAKIINLSTRQEVRFMFNPFEYTLQKSNQWEKKNVMGVNLPEVTFVQGGAITLNLTLHFDSLEEGRDVRGYVDPLLNMMMIDASKENARSGKGSPPPVAFSWGSLYFKSIITSISIKFTLFTAEGVPVRCEASVSLEQYTDESKLQSQVKGRPGASRAKSSSGFQIIAGSTRIDHVAAAGGGGSAAMRRILSKNKINNPLKLRRGRTLST